MTGRQNAYHLRQLFLSIEPRRDHAATGLLQGDAPRHYYPIYSDVVLDPTREPGATPCNSVVDAAFVASEGLAADITVVEQRINKVRAKNTPIPERFYEYRKEFSCVLRELSSEKLLPLPLEDLVELATGRKLKDYAMAAESVWNELIYKSFQKVEAYAEIKDPRNISNVDKRHVVRYLCYMRVVSNLLKERAQWYAFGKKPSDVAQSIHELANRFLVLYLTDFSRFDGTLSEFIRESELFFYTELFDERCQEELEELFGMTLDQNFRTKHGVCYNCGSGRCSGSGCTSVGNTLCTAFSCFVVLRECGLDYYAARDALGMYGGDDGVTHFPDEDIAKATMKTLELKFKISCRTPGEKVDFLGRIYPDAWSGPESHHDIIRAASKLHFSSSFKENVGHDVMAWRKAVSIFVTDQNTPIIGDWARAVLRVVKEGTWVVDWKNEMHNLPFADNEKIMSSRIVRDFPEPIFPGPSAGQIDDALRDFVDSSPIDLTDVRAWRRSLKRAKTLADFPTALWVVEPEANPNYPVVVDDQMLGKKPEPAPKNPCRAWAAGNCKRKGSCHYDHDEKEKNTAEVCDKYLAGECTRAPCYRRHPQLCRDAQRGACKREKDCKFFHAPQRA
jgi:hypothetical protein